MKITFDSAKHDQAIQVIADNIRSLPKGEQESEAKSMARWFISNIDKITVNMSLALTPGTEEGKKLHAIAVEAQRMASAAVAKAN